MNGRTKCAEARPRAANTGEAKLSNEDSEAFPVLPDTVDPVLQTSVHVSMGTSHQRAACLLSSVPGAQWS